MKKYLFLFVSILALIIACSKEDEPAPPPPTPKFTVSFSAGEGGSVSTSGGTYDKGTKVTVTATPDGEFLFDKWSDGNTDNPREITVSSNLSLSASFVKKKYALSVTVEGEGTVEEEIIVQGSTSSTEYNSGTTVKLTATPSDEWVFSGWSGDIESTDNPIEVSVDEAKSITATFKLKQYDLIVTVEGQGAVSETIVTQPTLYDSGTVVKLEATPSDEWVFSGWSGDIESTDNPIEVSVDEAKSITATFKLKQYDLTVTVEGEGTVSETIVTQPTLYDSGTVVKLEATPSDEWVFSGWSGDIESTDNPIEVSVDEAKSITATFKLKQYDLTVTVEGEGTVSETIITQPTLYDSGTVVKLEATPSDEWVFSGWSGDIESTDNPIEVSVDEAKSITATFKLKQYDLTVTVEGEGTVSETIVTQPTLYDSGTVVKLEATPSEGWEFVGWSGDIESTDNPIEVILDKEKNISAVFQEQTLSIQLKTEGNGQILNQQNIENQVYSYGDIVELTAVAGFQNEFVSWSDGLSPNKVINEIIMDDNKTITATFRSADYPIDIQTYEGGTTSLERENGSNNSWFSSNSSANLVATPNEGYTFHSWFGSVNSTDNPLRVTVNDTIKLRATFYKSDLNIKISTINYEHNEPYSIYQFISTIENISGTRELQQNVPRVLFPGHVYLGERICSDCNDPTNYRSYYTPSKSIEMIKQNGHWSISQVYDLEMWGPRNTKIKENKILVLDGNEIGPSPQDWEGNIYLGSINSSDIDWTRVTPENHMGYFHSGSFGDFNGDENIDVVGVSGNPPNGTESFFSSDNQGIFSLFTHDTEIGVYSADFAAELYDFDNDGLDEIIFPKKKFIEILKYDDDSNTFFSFKKIPNPLPENGPTSVRLSDFNNDGLIDLSIARESEYDNSFEVWVGKPDMEFENVFYQSFGGNELLFREFTILDVNNDGYMDIVLNGQGGTIPDISTYIQGREYRETNFKHYIWINDKTGRFSKPNSDFIIKNAEIIYLVPYMDNNNLHFMGPNHFNFYGTMDVNYQETQVGVKIWDVEIPKL